MEDLTDNEKAILSAMAEVAEMNWQQMESIYDDRTQSELSESDFDSLKAKLED
tara:strand:+ start:6913 stop:7071 length:159 start_codon:yes stop_codon:yes gene_type:complete